jgi:hypothetical protein
VSKRLTLILGWLWPFVVAVVGIAIISTGYHVGDGEVELLLIISLFGAGAVLWVVRGWLPARWPDELLAIVALLLTIPILAVEIYLAFILFAVGSGWIE